MTSAVKCSRKRVRGPSRPEKDEAVTLLEEPAIKVPAENKADAYDAALTALREDTRHW